MAINKTDCEIIYSGKSITADIMPYVVAVNFTDKAKGEADEIELTLEDSTGNWQSIWFPTQGETISLLISKAGKTLDCGLFSIDEITGSFSASGDTISIKGIGTGINKSFRTTRSYAHENKTLREIANTIAAKHGLNLKGNIPDIRIQRATQFNQTDIQFLNYLSKLYGLTFTIKGNDLIFTDTKDHERAESEIQLNRLDILSLSVSDKSTRKYRDAVLSYHNPKTKKNTTFRTEEVDQQNNSADSLVLHTRVENERQAEQILKAALHEANSLKQEGTIELAGHPEIVSGRKITISGFGLFSGQYYITESSHSISRDSEYTTTASIKKTSA